MIFEWSLVVSNTYLNACLDFLINKHTWLEVSQNQGRFSHHKLGSCVWPYWYSNIFSLMPGESVVVTQPLEGNNQPMPLSVRTGMDCHGHLCVRTGFIWVNSEKLTHVSFNKNKANWQNKYFPTWWNFVNVAKMTFIKSIHKNRCHKNKSIHFYNLMALGSWCLTFSTKPARRDLLDLAIAAVHHSSSKGMLPSEAEVAWGHHWRLGGGFGFSSSFAKTVNVELQVEIELLNCLFFFSNLRILPYPVWHVCFSGAEEWEKNKSGIRDMQLKVFTSKSDMSWTTTFSTKFDPAYSSPLLPLDISINFSAISTKTWELFLSFKCFYWFSHHCDPVAAFNTCFNFGGEGHTVRLHTHLRSMFSKFRTKQKIALTSQKKTLVFLWFYTWPQNS